MGNSTSGTVTKLLTLIPVLVAVYFYDFPRFLTAFSSPGVLAFFLSACSLLAIGVLLKRKILTTRLELSTTGFGWGLGLLAVAGLLYLYGSYSSDVVWYHFESLYVLIVAYVALRIGTSVLRALAPLLAIFALSYPPVSLFPDVIHQELIVFLAADLIFVFFLAYVGLRIRALVIPSAVLVLGVVEWFAVERTLLSEPLFLAVLTPVPALLLLIPQVRGYALLSRDSATSFPHDHQLLPNGFCSVCGWKITRASVSDNLGIWGLLAVLAVAALLLFPTLPVLAIVGGAPNAATYSPNGVSRTPVPQTPPGWQVNSTTLDLNEVKDAYAVTMVYVPQYHPETANYTVDFELSTVNVPTPNGPFGGDVAGWNRSSNVFTSFGPFTGYLTTYVAPGSVMVAYSGHAVMSFVNGGSFEQYFVGLAFVRQFKNSNVSSDTAQFMAALNSMWLPSITKDMAHSGWTTFLSTMYYDSQAASTFVLLASSMAIIGWIAYRARSLDDGLDHFLTVAAAQPEENFSCISYLLDRPRHEGTTQELGTARSSASRDLQLLSVSLRELEQQDLVKTTLVERGPDIVSVWRTVV